VISDLFKEWSCRRAGGSSEREAVSGNRGGTAFAAPFWHHPCRNTSAGCAHTV